MGCSEVVAAYIQRKHVENSFYILSKFDVFLMAAYVCEATIDWVCLLLFIILKSFIIAECFLNTLSTALYLQINLQFIKGRPIRST